MRVPARYTRPIIIGLVVLAVVVILAVASRVQHQTQPVEVPLSQVAAEVRAGNVDKIEVSGENLKVTLKDKSTVVSMKEANVSLDRTLTGLGVSSAQLAAVSYQVTTPVRTPVMTVLYFLLPVLLTFGLVMLVIRMTRRQDDAVSFGMMRARRQDIKTKRPAIRFSDVAGVEEAKQELVEIVEFLRDPGKFVSMGARIPKGVLLVGEPGTGKTLLAKAASGEAGVPFFSVAASEFVEQFVGVGASRVRDLFDQARRNSPCIVFVDELDAAGRNRSVGFGGSHDERAQTLNQLLVEMDGIGTDASVIVMAATNRPDILDPALVRPGRFDRRVILDRPDVHGRKQILEVHTKGKPLATDVDLQLLARATPGFVGADLENMVNEGAILAARRNHKAIRMTDLREAIERVSAGPERKSRVISDSERKVIAYHEAGHALVMTCLPDHDPVQKVSIVARGTSEGYTIVLPENDRRLYSFNRFKAELAGLLAGRVAEELVFGNATTGAANDLERATQLAQAMIKRYGMSPRMGPRVYGQKTDQGFLGREGEVRDYSEQVAAEIDCEVHALIDEAYRTAKRLLSTNHARLDRLAQALLDEETIESDRIRELCA